MRSRWNFLIVLVYAGIASTVLGFMAVNMAGPCLLNKCETLQVQFKDAAGLLHSNDLRVAGVKAGQVTKIEQRGSYALITLQVQKDFQPVYKDAHAIVRPKNLLGETYVEIDRGTPGAGEYSDGGVIPLANTITPVQVDEVLNALDADTRTKLGVVINGLGAATAQRGQDLNLGTADLQRIAAAVAVTGTTLDGERTNIDALIVQLDLMQKTAADYHEQLAQVLRDWNDTSTTLQRHDVQFSQALGHLSNVLATLDTALSPSTGNIGKAIDQLPGTIDNANSFLGISSKITDTYLNPPTPGADSPIRSGTDIFPRLAQVMLGTNQCDMHIYSNYVNVPGVTEPAFCKNPVLPNGQAADPTLASEPFSGALGPSKLPQDRHMWRVMGMLDNTVGCGLVSPGSLKPGTPAWAACDPGNNGLAPYQVNKQATSSGASGSAATPGGFFQQLWNDITGGAGA